MSEKQILVVDDDSSVQNVVRIMLETANYTVETANDGQEALEKLSFFQPDLIITDYHMPYMTGNELCIAVKKDDRFRSIPFIILTGLSDVPTKVQSLQNGAIDYITKPFSHEELLARVSTHLNYHDTLSSEFQKRIDETRANLLNNVSHELKTPLSLIMGHISLLLEDMQSIPDVQQQFLSTASQACFRLNRVVENLMFLAEAQSGKLVFYPTIFSIEALLQKTVASYSGQDTVQIQLNLPKEPMPKILADCNKLEIALNHLVENSMKFAYPNRPLQIAISASTIDDDASTQNSQPKVQISIQDNGLGLNEHQLPQIFELFHQADGSLTRTYGGMGAGLKIVNIITNMHKGSVTVQSQAGEGSTFSMTLPIYTNANVYADEIRKILDYAEQSHNFS